MKRFSVLPPDVEVDPEAFYWRGTVWCFIVAGLMVLALMGAQTAHGKDVVHPCYSTATARNVMQATPLGQEHKVWLLFNANSGPFWFADQASCEFAIDKELLAVAKEAWRRGFHTGCYIDAMIGGDYSPALIEKNGKQIVVSGGIARTKTAKEMRMERDKWLLYGLWDFWLIDDIRPGQDALLAEVATWKLDELFLNPGTAFTPPKALASANVIIHEAPLINGKGYTVWPRLLTEWEANHKRQCVVMGLKVTTGSLPAFLKSTAELGFRWASPLDDQWKKGQSAYTLLTPYLRDLLK